ncbi:MAG TPA: YciI family protein [Gemmatimonadaceae bacterium]|nr:YciI family protein [Gemmatimonadaceae bacterium]
MSRFMLFLHESPSDFANYSPEEMQKIIEKYSAWSQKMAQAGKLAGAEKLKDEGGRVLTRKNGQVIVRDGPYSETKELVGGFFLLEAKDYREAEALARDCPHLEYGGRIEIREVDPIHE